MDTWLVAGVLSVALFASKMTNAADVSIPGVQEQAFDFDIPALPLRSATEAFARRIGGHTYIGHETFEACHDFMLEPLVGRFTAQEGWRKLTAPICAASGVVPKGPGKTPLYLIDHPWVAEREIRIPRASLIDALSAIWREFPGLLLEYRTTDSVAGQQWIGPIEGTLGAEGALRRVEREIGAGVHLRRTGTYAFVIETEGIEEGAYTSYHYPRTCTCPVNVEEPLRGKVTVTEAAIVERPAEAVRTIPREQIEAIGAATLPQLFRYLAQNGYTRPEGYIASGAQYADFRGLGRDTHLVTINGRRTLPSANNVTSSAFDLNTIPLPAVDHIDIHVDAGSIRAGSDAIAGTIDIVTRREFEDAITVRYGFADDGARERRLTLGSGGQGGAGSVAVLADYFETGDLFGRDRALSRDQDYSRFGGQDYREVFAIYSLDDTELPGLQQTLAGLPYTRTSDAVSIAELMPGEPQRVSLARYQSVVPATTRASVVGSADYVWRGLDLAADLLWVKRDAVYRHFPAIAAGLVSADHPDNPFDAPVRIASLMTGAPSMEQHVESELRRGVFSVRGPLGGWLWELTLLNSDERAEAWLDHTLDPQATARALLPEDENSALDVFAMRPSGIDAPREIWAQPFVQRFSSAGSHLLSGLQGPIGKAYLQLGMERRAEQMDFNAAVGRVEREVHGGFGLLTLPFVTSQMRVPGVNRLTGLAGMRRDEFRPGESITRRHWELKWNVTDRLSLDANVAEQYRPPSLFELNLPKVTVPVQLYDPARKESVAASMIAGGNPMLRPTTGKSTHIRASYDSPTGFSASLTYFSIRLWDRIAPLPIPVVLAAETQLTGRVERAARTPAELEAGVPGRLISIDTSRDNVGRLFTRGVDASIERTFETAVGSFTPRAGLTLIDAFRYSDSPLATALMTDRVGIASEQGTITPWRAVLSLRWHRQAWAGTSYVRLIPSYEDVGGGRIGSQQLLDVNVSYQPIPGLTLTLGAMDLADTSPHFARIGAATGYDSSQWDPVGRRVMFTAKVSLEGTQPR